MSAVNSLEKKGDVRQQINQIRQYMKEENVDAYIIRSSDYHNSEYTGEYFKCREYISGFTGSAGDLVILAEDAGLWTDGRYFLQAEQELAGSGITLQRMKEEGVKSVEEYLAETLPEGGCAGMDGRTVSVEMYQKLEKALSAKNIRIRLDCDFAGAVWCSRPDMSCEPVWELDLCYAGRSRAEKLSELRRNLEEKEAECTIISSLDDIAWLLNIRGNDIACTPVALSYLAAAKDYIIWFVQQDAVNAQLKKKLAADGVVLRSYNEIYTFLTEELKCKNLYLDLNRTNIMLYKKAENPAQGVWRKIIKGNNLTMLPKAVKNPIEIENERKAHRKDAAACIKFIYWLKTSIRDSSIKITELSAAEKLEKFRSEQEHYLGSSFQTIAGYAHHGAIVHYSASAETDIMLKPENLLLIDSGGHYLEGTTDITRTVALGELTQEQKHHYTLVLKGNLKLGAAKFKYGVSGINLDYLARESMWQEGLDYNHGTGHGVGYLLNVHESPNSIRIHAESMDECTKLEEGMITSNEPGLYLEGKYGIRLENLIVCRKDEKSAYGQFMRFETLTLVPFERDAIIAEELTKEERAWLNAYHAEVYQKIGPYLNTQERAWLKEVTAEI